MVFDCNVTKIVIFSTLLVQTVFQW